MVVTTGGGGGRLSGRLHEKVREQGSQGPSILIWTLTSQGSGSIHTDTADHCPH